MTTRQEVRKLWTDALTSGEFKQGTGSLRPRPDEYCCLGVLCVLAEREGVIEAWNPLDSHPPFAVVDWVGLEDASGSFGSGCLVDLNDRPTSFATIADVIRAEPEGLFMSERVDAVETKGDKS